jgi:hypothetical protein
MTIPDFKRDLLQFRKDYSDSINYHLSSPTRVQSIINHNIAFLKSIKFKGKLKLKIEESINYLQMAYAHSENFSKGLRSDLSRTDDLAAIHIDEHETIWSIQVIGTAETAIDNIVRFLDNGS